MPKDPWRNYAAKKGLQQKGYFQQHPDRDACREAAKASNSNRNERCRKVKEEEVVDISNQLKEEGFTYKVCMGPPMILNDDWVINLREKDGINEILNDNIILDNKPEKRVKSKVISKKKKDDI